MIINALTNALGVSENTANTIVVTVFALAAVFLFLAVIWLIVSIHEKLHKNTEGTSQTEEIGIPSVEISDDNAVIAAISAAIATILEEEAAANNTPYNGFRIVSFKRENKGRAWRKNNK